MIDIRDVSEKDALRPATALELSVTIQYLSAITRVVKQIARELPAENSERVKEISQTLDMARDALDKLASDILTPKERGSGR